MIGVLRGGPFLFAGSQISFQMPVQFSAIRRIVFQLSKNIKDPSYQRKGTSKMIKTWSYSACVQNKKTSKLVDKPQKPTKNNHKIPQKNYKIHPVFPSVPSLFPQSRFSLPGGHSLQRGGSASGAPRALERPEPGGPGHVGGGELADRRFFDCFVARNINILK